MAKRWLLVIVLRGGLHVSKRTFDRGCLACLWHRWPGAITGSPFSCSYFTLGKVSKVNFGVLLDQDFLQVDVPHVAQSTASNHWVRKSTHKRNITVNSIQYDQYHKALCTKPTQTGPASVTKVAKCGKCMLKQKNENNLLKVTHVHAWQLVSIGLLEV